MFNLNSIKNKLILITLLVAIGMLAMIILQMSVNSSLRDISRTDLRISNIKSGMLTLRRDEKDFMMRLDTKYLDKFNQDYKLLMADVSLLGSELETQGMDANKALKLTSILQEYRNEFVALVEQQKAIGLDPVSGLYGDLRDAVHQVESKYIKLKRF